MTKIRKQLYLDPEEDARLRDLAFRLSCSETHVIRLALNRLADCDPDEIEDDVALTDEELEALEEELDEWARQHPEPLGLSQAVFEDREGR